MTPASARSRTRAPARKPITPRGPRRVSGPVAAPAGGAGLPRATSAFERIRALPDHRLVDRLLRSRLWIWALGALLGGIVTMQVSLLKLNSGISRAVETTTTLERQNADLEASIAQLSSPDRIEAGASTLGMVMPPAGDVRYLTSGDRDGVLAARRMQPPSDDAAELMANHGVVPGSLAPPLETTLAPATSAPATATTPAPVTTPVPAAASAPTTTSPLPATAAQG